jgi:branched-subunit amino acid transport protein
VDLAFLIAAMTVVTFTIRYSMIALLGRQNVPQGVRIALNYVPIAAFSAIIAPELFVRANQIGIALNNPRLIAGVVAIVVAAFTRQILLTIIAGMAVLWLAQMVLR